MQATMLDSKRVDLGVGPIRATLLDKKAQIMKPYVATIQLLHSARITLTPKVAKITLLDTRTIRLSLPAPVGATMLDKRTAELIAEGPPPPDAVMVKGINWWLWIGIAMLVGAVIVGIIARRKG